MFVHVVYGSESGNRIVKCLSTAADILQSVAHGLVCALYLYNEHNGYMGHCDLVENCRSYVVKRKPNLLFKDTYDTENIAFYLKYQG